LAGGIVSYFAAAAVRDDSGWTVSEVNLREAEDAEDIEVAADLLRDVAEGDLALLFVEADDEYLVILRLDEGGDLRIFGSDAAYADESALGGVLLGDLGSERLPDLDESKDISDEDKDGDERSSADSDSNPVGDADLLEDLGISDARLLALCAKEGMMPSDVTATICEILGCADEVEKLRESSVSAA
jgi:putative tRNA adenosine deaminase-associated protein